MLKYFVTETYVKDETPILLNVDFKTLAPWMKTAAETRVKNILGRNFYAYLLQKYNDEDLSTLEQELCDQIRPVVAWFGASLAIPDTNKKLGNKGQQRQQGQFTTPVQDIDEIRGIDQYASTGRYYLNELKLFLVENGGNYPQYTAEQNQKSDGFKDAKQDEELGYNDSILII